MTVCNPLIKGLKGCTAQFLGLTQPVTDDCETVPAYCQILEQILQQGLLVKIHTFGTWKRPEAWHWLYKISHNVQAPYLYQLCAEKASKSQKVKTDLGRTRLLIRLCLNNRCLYVPFQLLMETKEYIQLYSRESVLGSEILSQILMSGLLLPPSLEFKLNCDNARFLDDSWHLPTAVGLTLVPSKRLGIALTFVDDKAIAVDVRPDSIASENDQVEVGDVVDELNSVVLTAVLQGNLGQVLKKSAGRPITVFIVKAKHKGELYRPLVALLKRAGLNPTKMVDLNNSSCAPEKGKSISMMYMGRVLTGDKGDVKEIKRVVNVLLAEPYESIPVIIDCLEMGVIVTRVDDSSVLLKHTYMQISACGCTVQVPNYFAYITEDRSVVAENRFVCHVFYSDNQELIDNTLMSIGQGFKRTHFAV